MQAHHAPGSCSARHAQSVSSIPSLPSPPASSPAPLHRYCPKPAAVKVPATVTVTGHLLLPPDTLKPC
eukprot:11217-Chlamydomonas_euryale.AAC.4